MRVLVVLVSVFLAVKGLEREYSNSNAMDLTNLLRIQLKQDVTSDEEIILKQKFVFDILINSNRILQDDSFLDEVTIVDEETYFTNFDDVKDFIRLARMKNALLPRNAVFNIANRKHREQITGLFNLLFYSKDFATFRANALWGLKNVNRDMLVLALYSSILHRDDFFGVKLPSLYEILPEKFHTSLTMNNLMKQQSNWKFDRLESPKSDIWTNKYTSAYSSLNEESKLAYLTEDIEWNQYHFYFNMMFPSWLGGKNLGLVTQKRGERYLNLLQQLTSRINLERYSNGLGKIKDISLWQAVETGYNPLLVFSNGIPYSSRNNYFKVTTTYPDIMQKIFDVERRIREGIDKGYFVTKDGGMVDIRSPDATDILGNVIQSSKDSPNTKYYAGLVRNLAVLLGGGTNVAPSVLENYETALRDPVIYQLYKRVLRLYYQFKDSLPAYKAEDLLLDGVRIMDLKTSKLITYFDTTKVDMTPFILARNGMDLLKGIDSSIQIRHARLNHKPFTISIDVYSERPQQGVVRLFLGPKFDHDGKLLRMKDNREDFMELDKFAVDLKPGKQTISHSSDDSIYTIRDRTSLLDLYKNVVLRKNIDVLVDTLINEPHYKFPDRLLLPKGWANGMPLQLFAIITKAKEAGELDTCSTQELLKRRDLAGIDDVAFGFPFDRRIDEVEFYTPNMIFKDVFIFHEEQDGESNTYSK